MVVVRSNCAVAHWAVCLDMGASMIDWKQILIMAIVALATLSGCASIPKAEYVYQGLHAVDALQTVDIKHHPNFRETNPIIGEHPSDGDILVYMAAEAALHLLITQQLEQHNAPKWAKVIWHSISIGWAGRQVIHNYDIGLRP